MRNSWKQTNPKDQMIVLLSAIEGWVNNLSTGETQMCNKEIEAKINDLLKQVSELSSEYLPESW